jgi:hypothetical protein
LVLAGDIVEKQQSKALRQGGRDELRKVYRKAKEVDIEKWKEWPSPRRRTPCFAIRQIAKDLGLNMKIGDVEYQGDNTKAIFYYIADERVDFRELIKVLAETFRIRIEMKQIGAQAGSWPHRGHWNLWKGTVLLHLCHPILCFGKHPLRQDSGSGAESAEIGRSVRKIQVLSEL